jgi:hypothetical protein
VVGAVVGSVVGSVVGAVVGSVVGAVVGSVVGSVVGAVVGSVVGLVVGAVVGSVAGAVVGVVTSSWVVPPAIGSSSSSVPAAHTVMGRQLRTRHRARTQLKKVRICFIYVPSFLGSIYTVIIFQKIANFKQITFGTAGNIWKRK